MCDKIQEWFFNITTVGTPGLETVNGSSVPCKSDDTFWCCVSISSVTLQTNKTRFEEEWILKRVVVSFSLFLNCCSRIKFLRAQKSWVKVFFFRNEQETCA